MTTTTIESTVVKLDGLHAAYKEVLDQDKQQLEDVDLTPVIINGLAARPRKTASLPMNAAELLLTRSKKTSSLSFRDP